MYCNYHALQIVVITVDWNISFKFLSYLLINIFTFFSFICCLSFCTVIFLLCLNPAAQYTAYSIRFFLFINFFVFYIAFFLSLIIRFRFRFSSSIITDTLHFNCV